MPLYHAMCKICNPCVDCVNSDGSKGKSHRLEIEDLLVQRASLVSIMEKFPCLHLNSTNLATHQKNHMAHLHDFVSKLTDAVAEELVKPETLPNEVITSSAGSIAMVEHEINVVGELTKDLQKIDAELECEDPNLKVRLWQLKLSYLTEYQKLTGQSSTIRKMSMDQFMVDLGKKSG